MDNDIILDDASQNSQIVITSQAKSFLKETASWAQFLAIIGFIGLGFLVLVGISMNYIMGSLGDTEAFGFYPTTYLTAFYLILALLYFFPVLNLYRFASNTKQALRTNDTQKLTEALGYLKSHYKIIGLITATFMALYILMIVGIGVAGTMF